MTTTDTIALIDTLERMGMILHALIYSPLAIFLLFLLPLAYFARKAL